MWRARRARQVCSTMLPAATSLWTEQWRAHFTVEWQRERECSGAFTGNGLGTDRYSVLATSRSFARLTTQRAIRQPDYPAKWHEYVYRVLHWYLRRQRLRADGSASRSRFPELRSEQQLAATDRCQLQYRWLRNGRPALSAIVITTATTYQILGQNSVLSIGNNPSNDNVFLGIGAGGNYPGSGEQNTFVGTQAGYSNNGSSENTFTGNQAGYSTTFGQGNTFVGTSAGMATPPASTTRTTASTRATIAPDATISP